ncbi:MAG: family 16 glycosylhydrolase [Methylotetracoccus sp.]
MQRVSRYRNHAIAFCLFAAMLPGAATAGWQLTFADEFSGSTVDSTKWIRTDAWGNRGYPAQGELECYLPSNFSLSGGVLSIIAKEENQPSCLPTNPDPTRYSSGMLTTAKSFQQQYGYFEIRARLPKGKGLWPAFWLLPADLTVPPEIDVMESIGSNVNSVFLALHYTESGQYRSSAGWFAGPDFSAGFHTFGVDWQPGVLTFYGDGVQRYQAKVSGVPNKPMYLIVNLAVGGDWAGFPDATTPFPSELQVDYIRAYRRVNDGTPDSSPPSGGGTVDSSLQLMRSSSPDRAGAAALAGASLAGDVYVFCPDLGGINRIEFALDGSPYRTEGAAPYDFAGTASSGGGALPFALSSLTKGTHSITAKAFMGNGTTQMAAATFTVGGTSTGSGILMSKSPNRTAPVDLNGRTVAGDIYVFVAPSGVSRVQFLMDGVSVKVENQAPFDLAGTAASGGTANAFSTSGLKAGNHTLRAVVTRSNGQIRNLSAEFER